MEQLFNQYTEMKSAFSSSNLRFGSNSLSGRNKLPLCYVTGQLAFYVLGQINDEEASLWMEGGLRVSLTKFILRENFSFHTVVWRRNRTLVTAYYDCNYYLSCERKFFKAINYYCSDADDKPGSCFIWNFTTKTVCINYWEKSFWHK